MIKRRAKKGVAKSNADANNATTPAPAKERFDILTVEEITRRYHMMDGWENFTIAIQVIQAAFQQRTSLRCKTVFQAAL